MALTRLTYDLRLMTTVEGIIVRDSDGIRAVSLGTLASSDGHTGQSDDGKGNDGEAAAEEASASTGATGTAGRRTSRRMRHTRREHDTTEHSTNAKQKVEAAAAAMAETQKRETGALLLSFIACDKR